MTYLKTLSCQQHRRPRLGIGQALYKANWKKPAGAGSLGDLADVFNAQCLVISNEHLLKKSMWLFARYRNTSTKSGPRERTERASTFYRRKDRPQIDFHSCQTGSSSGTYQKTRQILPSSSAIK
ncbi:hypothetical protein GWK47_052458 [Chionoecetes opilio]|uniref:Uncharacterized protein n=1 Tax=Chionoecetes opilio TaxID=41210 RepID=A0A8J5CRS2_CHIOP|nr:hypothetical protein GWK47_052458 [Chionoecetes opilio]